MEERLGVSRSSHQPTAATQQLVRSPLATTQEPVKRAVIGLFKCGRVEHTERVDEAILEYTILEY